MKQQTCILFGKSGSGKGTQAELLSKYLKEHDPSRKVIYVETGQRFRDFLTKNTSYTAGKIKEVMAAGGLLPAFIPIWMWTSLFIDEMTGDDHIVLDGLSRREIEAPIVSSAMEFYGRDGATVLLLDVSSEEVTKRLIKRGRHDDHDEKIKERLAWFETDVMPAVNYFKTHPFYTFVNINGEQSIEDVHKEILAALDLS